MFKMKSVINNLLVVLVAASMITACQKVENLPVYQNGTAALLKASATSISPVLADANKVVLTLNWTYPNYAVADPNSTKYLVQIDSAGRNFTKAITKEVKGDLQATFTANELNNILLGYGFALGTPYKLDFRVISSYPNNNERITSNVVNVSLTAFSEPSTLTSSASTVTGTVATALQTALTFNWTQSFKSYSGAVTYTIEYDSATKNFASPQEIAAGTSVFSKALTYKNINEAAISEGIPAGNSGKLEFRIKAMTALGAVVYSNVLGVTVNSYIPLIDYQFPKALWVAGNFQGWSPSSAPKIVDPSATGTTGTNYEGYINFTDANPEFKLVKGPDWPFGDFGSGAAAGQLGSVGNLKLTTGAGVYLFKANTDAMTWSAVKINSWGIIGSATPNGWDASTPMTLNSNGTYSITVALTGGNELKFRANDSWDINFGDNKNGGLDGIPDYGGDNIAIATSGNYLVTLNLTSAGNYTYTIKKV